MKRFLNLTLITLMGLGLSLSACKKDKDTELDADTETAQDNNTAESNFDEIFKEIDQASDEANLQKAGPAITIDSSASPVKMTIDYGANGTIGFDGKNRKGKIIVTWTGRYRATGTVITVTFDQFYQNDYLIAGTKTIKNEGRNTDGNLYYTITVADARITSTTGRTIAWNAQRTRTWIGGENTVQWRDDVYLISGTTNGITGGGRSYTLNIVTPLRVDLSCIYRITSGVLDITPQGKTTRTIDYGNGACDNTITVTINGKTYTIRKV